MNAVRFLPTVKLVPSSAGTALLWAFQQWVNETGQDWIVTSGADGTHSGTDDPHFKGDAFDGRSHDFLPSDKDSVLRKVLNYLGTPVPQSGGYVTSLFFGWLEQAGTDNEHFHFQLRHGLSYPPSNNSESVRDAVNAEN